MTTLRRHDAGFALVEILAAFAILILVLAALLAAVPGAARKDSRADFMLRAVRFAKSRLAAANISEPLSQLQLDGRTEDGLAFRRTVQPLSGSDFGDASQLAAFRVTVTVWPRSYSGFGTPFVISTIKLGHKGPAL